MQCPACHAELVVGSTAYGAVNSCTQCAGVLIHLSELRSHVSQRVADALWGGALGSPPSLGRRCPRCAQPFRVYDVRYGRREAVFELDTCISCEWFWFDPTELQRIPLGHNTPARQSGGSDVVFDLLTALVELIL